ncbi:histidine phosphatase family protein [Gorillibacterium sp. sgz5001074]|uniref:histidine phosphatase family protein n=1 Tax=Gorillibacterium sp. sgz5001074 TaxID=3446695 RepID=UPI003F663CB3
MKLYIVRHCSAAGQEPAAPLTDKGRAQAEALCEFLSGLHIEEIFSSPYLRAVQSISPLAQKLRMSIRTDERLSERILCGENRPDWCEMLRNTFQDLDLQFEGGESSRAAMQRAVSVIREISESGLNRAVIVTHGNLLSLLLHHYDRSYGYEAWEALTNPDVYLLENTGESYRVERVWR